MRGGREGGREGGRREGEGQQQEAGDNIHTHTHV